MKNQTWGVAGAVKALTLWAIAVLLVLGLGGVTGAWADSDSASVVFNVAGDTSYGLLKAYVGDDSISSGDSVAVGDTVIFVAEPKSGYKVKEWKIEDDTLDEEIHIVSDSTGKIKLLKVGVDSSMTVSVEFEVDSIAVDSVSIENRAANKALVVGDTLTFIAKVYPESATVKAVTWTSSDTAVAKIDTTGKITALKGGSSVVKVTAVGDTAKTDTITVTVTVPVDSVSITNKTANKELVIDDTLTFIATVYPTNATIKDVTWTSSDTAVATVDTAGTVTAVDSGTAVITVKAVGDTAKTDTITVTVNKAPIAVDSVSIENRTANKALVVGDTLTFIAKVYPESATVKTVMWTSSDTAVAKIDTTGTVTAVKGGSSVIKVTAVGDTAKTDTITVTVTVPVDSVSITNRAENKKLAVDDTLTFKVAVYPNDATNKSVTWLSSDTAVAKIDTTGKVTAVDTGTAVITVKAVGDTSKTDTITVAVTKDTIKVDSVSITNRAANKVLFVDSTLTFTATVYPTNATIKDVTWTSSDTAVATVDTTGTVTAVDSGTAVITVKAVGDTAKTDTITVTVNKAPIAVDSVSIENRAANKALVVGDTLTFIAKVYPESATVKAVTWTSSDTAVAKIDTTGKVTAVKGGSSVIKVTAVGDTAKMDTITVAVTVPVDSVSITNKTANKELVIDDTLTFIATVYPTNATIKDVTWTSSDTAVATVDTTGTVTAVDSGTAVITVKAVGDTAKTDTITVTVNKAPIAVDSVSIENRTANKALVVGDTLTFIAKVYPESATVKTVMWTSSDTAVAKIDTTGKVTALKGGSSVITVRAVGDTAKTDTIMVAVTVPVDSVSIMNRAENKKLAVDDTLTFKVAVYPNDATNKSVTWLSSDTAVAKIDTTGKVTAVDSGTTRITVRAVGDTSKTDTITVAVTKDTIKVDSVSITNRAANKVLFVDSTLTFTATVYPTNATIKGVEWSSNDTTVATIDTAGKVTAVDTGTAVITVKAVGDTAKTDTITVTVNKAPIAVDSVTIENRTANKALVVGDTLTFIAKVYPESATVKDVTWTSSDTAVAKIDTTGKITALKGGSSVIKVTAVGDTAKMDTITVTVTVPVDSVSITNRTANKKLAVDDTLTFIATVYPNNATNKSVTWLSSDTAVAKINTTGKVTAVDTGTAVITVKAVGDTSKTDTITVAVTKDTIKVDSVSITNRAANKVLFVDSTLTFTATVYPTNATIKGVTWSSKDTGVATVNTIGKVTAVDSGTTVITVKAVGDTTKSDTITVTVKKDTATAPIAKYLVTFNAGSNGKLTATVNGTAIASGDSVAANSNVIFVAKPDSNVFDVDTLKVIGKGGTRVVTIPDTLIDSSNIWYARYTLMVDTVLNVTVSFRSVQTTLEVAEEIVDSILIGENSDLGFTFVGDSMYVKEATVEEIKGASMTDAPDSTALANYVRDSIIAVIMDTDSLPDNVKVELVTTQETGDENETIPPPVYTNDTLGTDDFAWSYTYYLRIERNPRSYQKHCIRDRKEKVTFSVAAGNGGALSAKVGNVIISTNRLVAVSKSVVFTAVPQSGKAVNQWTKNGQVVSPAPTKITEYTLSGSRDSTCVTVSFKGTYTVTFYPDGGTVEPASANVDENGKLSSLPTPTKSGGFVFDGWYTNAVGGTKVGLDNVYSKNTTIYAHWIVEYTITFNGNGGTPASSTGKTGSGGVIAAFPVSPTRSNYAFDGWYTLASGGDSVAATRVFTANATVYAHWVPAYTVTFNANGGAVSPSSVAVRQGGVLESTPTPTRAGYAFDGWYTSSSGGTVVAAGVSVTANMTVYARWTVVTYTITFDASGGEVSPASMETVAGGKLASLPTPKRDGYTFSGWFTESVGGVKVTTGTVFTESAAVYAQWAAVTYTVSYNLNGGVEDADNKNPKSYTIETAGFPLTAPTRAFHIFEGWTGSNGKVPEPSVNVGQDTLGNKSYTANWTLIVYTVNFDANGGTVTPESGKTGSTGRLSSLPTPKREGYAFNGWFTDASGGTKVTTSAVYDGDGVTLYAQWSEVYEVEFDAAGGNVTPQFVKTGAGGKIASLPTPVRDGYTFDGWYVYVPEDDSERKVTTGTVFEADEVVFARWSPVGYAAVTFDGGSNGTVTAMVDGSPIESGESVRRDKSVVFKAVAADGYSVARWIVNGVVSVDTSSTYTLVGLTGATEVAASFGTVSVVSAGRVVPVDSDGGVAAVSPALRYAGGFAAGPNPVSKGAGRVAFFSSKAVSGGALYVFDAAGGLVASVAVNPGAGEIGSWDLKDSKGSAAPGGPYLVRGVLLCKDGAKKKVSLVIGVAR